MDASAKTRVVLVVEDDVDLRDSIVEILRDHDFVPVPAANGQEALDRLRGDTPSPSLILLDIMMPVMDGFEFREHQSADPELSQIPVVVLSAHSDVAETAEQMRVEAFLRKPVHLEDLLETVRRYCQPPGPA